MRPLRDGEAERWVFVFDFGGVVLKWRNNYPIYDFIAERYAVPRAAFRREMDATLPRLESGKASIGRFLKDRLGAFGKELRPGENPEWLWTEPFARLAKLRIGTVEVVESLRRRGFRVYLFSNTSLPHLKFVKEVGWAGLFDDFVGSCELGSVKPRAEAFASALRRFHASPDKAVYIDDREANVRGAKLFGIRRALRFTSVERLRRDIAKFLRSPVKGRRDSSFAR